MSYKKGKDIKVPFDCLWHYYTRRFEPVTRFTDPEHIKHLFLGSRDKPEDFENHEVQDLQ